VVSSRARAFGAQEPTARKTYAEAISLFDRALTLDPRAVEAQSRLAIHLAGRVTAGMSDTATADILRARDLAERAVAASPRSPLAHMAKAQVLYAQNRCDEAVYEYETVLTRLRRVHYRSPAENVVEGVERAGRPGGLPPDQLDAKRDRDPPRDVVFQGEQIADVTVKLLGPQKRIGLGVDQLGSDADLVARPTDTSWRTPSSRPICFVSADLFR
jgi:tetratricopeptide (TPR) repeat protein